MSSSRNRKRRYHSRHDRRYASDAMRGREVRRQSIRSLVENPPDDHDLGCLVHAQEAGARGDAQASLACELAGRVPLASPHRFMLQDLIDQGDTAPAWAYSRWCADLAYRSMMLEADPRTDAAVSCVLDALYPESLHRLGDDPMDLKVLGTTVAAGDHLVADLVVHELGGLTDYLDMHAEAGLLARPDRIRDWADAPLRAFAFVDFRGCRLVLRDLVGGGEVEALNIGAMSQATDETLIGRLVPISCEPGVMFATRPIFVDPPTARHVADAVRGPEPLAWITALSEALTGGRQSEGFHRAPPTLFTSDLPIPPIDVNSTEPAQEEAGKMTELRGKGYSADVANALCVLEVGLISANMDDHAAAVVSPSVVTALSTAGAFEAALTECTGRDTADAWRILAAVVPEHAAERCRLLAARADGAEKADAHQG